MYIVFLHLHFVQCSFSNLCRTFKVFVWLSLTWRNERRHAVWFVLEVWEGVCESSTLTLLTTTAYLGGPLGSGLRTCVLRCFGNFERKWFWRFGNKLHLFLFIYFLTSSTRSRLFNLAQRSSWAVITTSRWRSCALAKCVTTISTRGREGSIIVTILKKNTSHNFVTKELLNIRDSI